MEVGEMDEIDIFECLHAEPTAVEYFYKADETLKEALYKKDGYECVKAMDEAIGAVGEMLVEDWPHTHYQVCARAIGKDFNWDNFKRIGEELRNKDTTLMENSDHHLFFNKQDITGAGYNMIDYYVKREFRTLGWHFGKTLYEASKASKESKFLQWN